ncbi:unnamed protein product [Parajaminaea phylloscopi]
MSQSPAPQPNGLPTQGSTATATATATPLGPDMNEASQPSQQPSRADPTREAQENRRQALMKREEEEARKDRSLAELLGMLDTYRPVIPEEVTDYYLQKAGFESHDARLNRLLSISAEKFISDIVSDAYQYSRIRTNASAGGRPAGGSSAAVGGANNASAGGAASGSSGGADKSRTVLTMDDLSAALAEYGVNAKRADSYR